MGTLFALIGLLPKLMEIPGVGNLIKGIFKNFDPNNPKELQAWKEELERTINTIEKAETQDEKLAAAKLLTDSIRNL